MSQQESKKPEFITEKVRDSRSGDIFQVTHHLCHTCNEYIMTQYGHPECIRQKREEAAREEENYRQQQCKLKYGQVLSREEEQRRDYPNSRVWGRESYNEQLKREEEEKRQARIDELAQRRRRVKRLEDLKSEVKWLESQIKHDSELSAQERAAGLEV